MTTPSARRRAFAAAATVLGMPLGATAEKLGVTYNHLLLVLDGARRGSAQLEFGIRGVLEDAKPLLEAIVEGAFDAPASPITMGASMRAAKPGDACAS